MVFDIGVVDIEAHNVNSLIKQIISKLNIPVYMRPAIYITDITVFPKCKRHLTNTFFIIFQFTYSILIFTTFSGYIKFDN